MEVRSQDTGQVLARDVLGACLAALLVGAFRGGEPELLAVSTEGEVRGG